ncbi:centromere protein X-like [Mizuhopecten yessoensis]|uniref:centromere protein X-like n=1 Tax=Mizuhopecten yessoensis TaxID=6573 RepID=UPI000B45B8B4|nr:centromere protein X-like [Mizuhopecten yessoensis]
MTEGASFKQRTIQIILQEFFRDEKTKITTDAAALVVEVMNIFVSEAGFRVLKEAKTDDSDEVTIEHFEKILPQLLLDL